MIVLLKYWRLANNSTPTHMYMKCNYTVNLYSSIDSQYVTLTVHPTMYDMLSPA